MFKLKPISKEAIPAALEKAVHYRLRGEPVEAESICLDVLAVDPEHQEALVTMVLAVTDQFDGRMGVTIPRAVEILSRIRDAYARAYYAGVIWERQAKARLKGGLPGSGDAAYSDFRKAMDYYDKAEKIRPPGNDSAILRWNTCARIIMREPEVAPKLETFREEMLE
jgi:hypothetical protein